MLARPNLACGHRHSQHHNQRRLSPHSCDWSLLFAVGRKAIAGGATTFYSGRIDNHVGGSERFMLSFVLWLFLLLLCWPLALLALMLYPVFWLLTLPFRLIGIGVEGLFELLRAIVLLPARILRGSPGR
jgi:hypothetical protein